MGSSMGFLKQADSSLDNTRWNKMLMQKTTIDDNSSDEDDDGFETESL